MVESFQENDVSKEDPDDSSCDKHQHRHQKHIAWCDIDLKRLEAKEMTFPWNEDETFHYCDKLKLISEFLRECEG